MKFLFKYIMLSIMCFFMPELLFLFFFLTGFCLIIAHFLNKKHKYELISGIVIEIDEHLSKGRSASGSYQEVRYYTPIFQYIYKGKVYKIPHRINANIQNNCLFSIGQNIELRVYNKFPEKAVLNSHFSVNILLYGGLTFIIGTGIIMGMLLKGGKLNFYSLGERIQSVFLFFFNIIERIISHFF